MKSFDFDKNWTLFIDRDGVINKRIPNDYVKHWCDFIFIEGVFEAFEIFNSIFGKIIVVSNQQGIGKGLMSLEELNIVHENMVSEIENNGGRIDKIYFSPYLENENSIYRKPNIGMAMDAMSTFPEIDLEKSIMVGDSYNDMKFGANLNIENVLISVDEKEIDKCSGLYIAKYQSLIKFAIKLK